MKLCERCDNPAIKGERFCKECKKQVLSELKSAGYLQNVPLKLGNIHTSGRTTEQAENTRETKYGRD
jgi:predicted amidophosphoribosyltransferase